MANEQVLVIDDSVENNQFIIDCVLQPNGYRALTAFNGEEGLKVALAQQPDLILLDLKLPKMSGLEVLEALNAHDVKAPVIVMTFHGSEQLAVQVFRLGVKDYVLKPFEISEMLESIERALLEARLKRERTELTNRLIQSNQELEQRVKELNTLFGIGKSVTSLHHQDRLLTRLVEAAIYLTNAEEAALWLGDDQATELKLLASCGLDNQTEAAQWPLQNSLAGEVIATGQAAILNSTDTSEIDLPDRPYATMLVPLKMKERVQGLLSVNNRRQARDFSNHDLRLLSTLADYAAITLENAQLFQQAESERTKLATVLNEIDELVIVIENETDRLMIANSAFRRTFGFGTTDIEGYSLADLLTNEALEKMITLTPAESVHRGQISVAGERVFNTILTPMPGIGRAIIMQDVTYLRDLELVKSNFVANISHDLRTPFVSLKGYTDMLGMVGPLTERQSLIVDRIGHGLEKMLALIDNLLDLSKIEAGFELDSTVLDLGQLAMEVISALQEPASRKRQQLVYHASSKPALVAADVERMRQVLSHLMENALKYTLENGHISAIVRVTEAQVLFKIEDDGLGVTSADLPFIFDKFYRVEDKDRSEIQGAGLGLAICKSVIEKYNGSIWAESEYHRGSTFTFSLPLAVAEVSETSQTPVLKPEVVPLLGHN